MAALVWFTMGVALWHFTVFVPDRFRGGIVGAFIGAIAGRDGHRRDRADRARRQDRRDRLATALAAIPGTLIGLAIGLPVGHPRRGRAGAPLGARRPSCVFVSRSAPAWGPISPRPFRQGRT